MGYARIKEARGEAGRVRRQRFSRSWMTAEENREYY